MEQNLQIYNKLNLFRDILESIHWLSTVNTQQPPLYLIWKKYNTETIKAEDHKLIKPSVDTGCCKKQYTEIK